MNVIIKAMKETEYKPRAKWWGFLVGTNSRKKRYLMRYHHCFAVFSKDAVLYANWETKTDKAGVVFAIEYFYRNKLGKV